MCFWQYSPAIRNSEPKDVQDLHKIYGPFYELPVVKSVKANAELLQLLFQTLCESREKRKR